MNKFYNAVLTSLILLFSTTVYSANWEKLYSMKSTDCFRNVREVSGGYVLAGYTANFTSHDTDGLVIKMDFNGDTIWSLVYNGPSSKEDCFYKIVPTSDGGYILCGYSRSFGNGDNAMYMKLNSSGHVQWVKNWGGSGIERAQDIIELPSGKFVICGYTTTSPAHYYDAFILKIDENGNTMWSKIYGGAAYDDANSLKLLSDGGFIMGGQSNSNFYLVRTDSNGDSLWTKAFGTSGTDNIECVNFAQGGDGFVVAGTTDGMGSGGEDAYLGRTDTGGVILWDEVYGGNVDDGFHRIEQTSDGNYVAMGTSNEGPWNDPNLWITKIDANGVQLWENFFGGANHDHCYSGQPTSDGGYILCGHTHSFANNNYNEDAIVIKTTSSGQVNNHLNYTTVSDLLTPTNSACGSDNVQVKVELTNFGDATVSSIPVTVEITGAITQTLTGTYSGSVTRDQVKTLTLTPSIDMSMGGTFNFHCYTTGAHDVYPARNYFDKTFIVGVTSQDPTVTNGSHCGPGTVSLSASSPDQLKWYAASTGGSSLFTGSNFTTPYITGNTIYYAQAGQACPSGRVAVNANITAGLASPTATDGSRCGNGTVSLSGAAGNPIKWYDSSTSLTVLQTGTTFTTPSLSSSGNYYIAAETATCSSPRVIVHAVVNPLPNNPVTTAGSNCGSGTVQLSATATDPIHWYAAASGGSQLGSGGSFTSPNISNNTTYYAEANDGTCSSSRVPALASILPLPQSPVITSHNICDSGSVILIATTTDSVVWYDAMTGGNLIGTGNNYTTPVISSTNVYYAQSIQGTCSSSFVPGAVNVNPSPVISLGPDTIFSSGASVLLDPGAGFASYVWSTFDHTQTYNALVSGNYCVTVTDNNNCTANTCTYVDFSVGLNEINTVAFTIYPQPASGLITINLSGKYSVNNICIMDLNGRVVFNKNIVNQIENINVSFLSKGIYVIQYNNEKVSQTRRLIID